VGLLNTYEIINNIGEEIDEVNGLSGLLDYSLNYLKLDNVVFNIIIVDNETIHSINKEYRGVDRPTDVISFALEDDTSFVSTEYRILGDIYISIDKAKEQAESYGHSLKREISFLTVHGLLHLLGYDHMTEEEEKEMFGLQELILDGYGIKR
jgi:probable rRNA maturation factor